MDGAYWKAVEVGGTMDDKPIPLRQGEMASSIPPASSSIAAMGIQGLERQVPEFHRNFLRTLGVRGSDVAQNVSQKLVGSRQFPVQEREWKTFGRGDSAIDVVKGVRVTVIKCGVGRTRKGSLIHRVVCKSTGESWKVAENKLRKIK